MTANTPRARKQLIARRLRPARDLAGLSQREAAKRLGMSRPSLSKAESGRRNVTAQELTRIAETYLVSVSWLVGVVPGHQAIDPADLRGIRETLQSLRQLLFAGGGRKPKKRG